MSKLFDLCRCAECGVEIGPVEIYTVPLCTYCYDHFLGHKEEDEESEKAGEVA